MARFKREAQVPASLNHPNIAAIYGLEDSAATHALVMKLVEGEDLDFGLAKALDPSATRPGDHAATANPVGPQRSGRKLEGPRLWIEHTRTEEPRVADGDRHGDRAVVAESAGRPLGDDGQRWLGVRPMNPGLPKIAVVLNFFEELRAKVPVK